MNLEQWKMMEEWLNTVERKNLLEQMEALMDRKLSYKQQVKLLSPIYRKLDGNYVALEKVRQIIAKMEGQQ
jgi:antibiotic biosynthesis monooxygenase (ABM) superfamily enzyme